MPFAVVSTQTVVLTHDQAEFVLREVLDAQCNGADVWEAFDKCKSIIIEIVD